VVMIATPKPFNTLGMSDTEARMLGVGGEVLCFVS